MDAAAQKVYWADSNCIFKANLADGSNVQTLGASGVGANSWASPWTSRAAKSAWTDSTGVSRSNLDGTAVQKLISTGMSYTPDIALDLTHGKFYFTGGTASASTISVANLDGSDCHPLLTAGASGIALDAAGGNIYWTDTSKIRCRNLDGSNIRDVLATPLTKSRGITVDAADGKMYWAEIHRRCCHDQDSKGRSGRLGRRGFCDRIE